MFRGFVIVVAGLVLAATVMGAAFAIQWITADVRGSLDAREQIKASGANRIAQYNRFFNECASIQSAEARIDELTDLILIQPTPFDTSIAITNLAAAKILRHEAIRSYNAEASKNYTNGQFRDSDLPYQIADTNYEKGGKKTVCAAN